MKKLLFIFLFLVGSLQWLSAATRAEVNVLEATENIRYLSQRITRNYLYLYANPLKREINRQIKKDLEELVASIRTISMNTNDQDTKNILEFLIYSKNQISDLIQSKPNKERAALMLDYSETLLEGANSIAKEHEYLFTKSEKMLMQMKSMEYLMERSAKYYLALGVGIGSKINLHQMEEALKGLEDRISLMKSYPYPEELRKRREILERFWSVVQSFFARREKLFASNLMALSGEEMEKNIEPFLFYHRKNQ